MSSLKGGEGRKRTQLGRRRGKGVKHVKWFGGDGTEEKNSLGGGGKKKKKIVWYEEWGERRGSKAAWGRRGPEEEAKQLGRRRGHKRKQSSSVWNVKLFMLARKKSSRCMPVLITSLR